MKIGKELKNIEFIIDDKKILSENDLKGKKIIIYFYPKDDTPGCTVEAIDFSSLKKKFEKLNTFIIGISRDSIKKHKKFSEKHNLSISLASDESGLITEKFGVWVEKSMYGKKYMGIERSTFLFDENLKLVKIWEKVKVKNHVDEVYNYILELS
tara:strand:+ start:2716 stop:3177 length:462 start_codon:yes stop_codon:yes gene_type:complete